MGDAALRIAPPPVGQDDGPDRPSRHGVALGRALVRMAEAGRAASAAPIPDPCATCALRPGTLPNISAGTGLTALNCVLGIDSDAFACHHGMKEGWPTKLCSGYEAACAAPFEAVRTIMSDLCAELDGFTGPDTVRADYDAWWREADPEGRLDVYQLGRLFQKHVAGTEP